MSQAPNVPTGAPADPDERPATRAELRGMRRWLVVTAVWAAAATAIAVIALLTIDDTAETEAGNIRRDIARLQSDLDRRLDEFDAQISQAAKVEDVTNLQKRLGRVEEKASGAATSAEDLKTRLDDLDTRLDDLQTTVDDLGSGAGNGNGNGNGGGAGNSP